MVQQQMILHQIDEKNFYEKDVIDILGVPPGYYCSQAPPPDYMDPSVAKVWATDRYVIIIAFDGNNRVIECSGRANPWFDYQKTSLFQKILRSLRGD